MNLNRKIVGRNNRSTVLGLNYLSDVVTNIITIIELVGKKSGRCEKLCKISWTGGGHYRLTL